MVRQSTYCLSTRSFDCSSWPLLFPKVGSHVRMLLGQVVLQLIVETLPPSISYGDFPCGLRCCSDPWTDRSEFNRQRVTPVLPTNPRHWGSRRGKERRSCCSQYPVLSVEAPCRSRRPATCAFVSYTPSFAADDQQESVKASGSLEAHR